MLTDAEKSQIVSSFRLVVPIAETAGDLFYQHLFEHHPQFRPLFPDDMSKQKRKFMTMLAFIVKSLDWTDAEWREEVDPDEDLCFVVLALGRRHANLYKIPDDAYGPVGEALLWTLDQGLGQAFTSPVREAWTKLYATLATTMKMGAKASRVDIGLGRVA